MLLVLGTHNRKKGIELQDLLAPWGFQLQTLAELPQAIEVAETGTTFAENAKLKAVQQAVHLKQWVLAEDSGLAVDALKGEPGVYSARFSGPNATDKSNNQLLCKKLQDVPVERRTAHYVCYAVLSDPAGNVRAESQGRCDGIMQLEPAGSGGFGYDPYFEVVEYHRTFGELGPAVKRALSHRGRAMRGLLPQLLNCTEGGQWRSLC